MNLIFSAFSKCQIHAWSVLYFKHWYLEFETAKVLERSTLFPFNGNSKKAQHYIYIFFFCVCFGKELETLEETWTNEARDLGHLVSQLKQENARLASALANQPSTAGKLLSLQFPSGPLLQKEFSLYPLHHHSLFSVPMSPELDHGIVERLQLKVDNLRDQSKKQEQRIVDLEKDLENVSCELVSFSWFHLSSIPQELRHFFHCFHMYSGPNFTGSSQQHQQRPEEEIEICQGTDCYHGWWKGRFAGWADRNYKGILNFEARKSLVIYPTGQFLFFHFFFFHVNMVMNKAFQKWHLPFPEVLFYSPGKESCDWQEIPFSPVTFSKEKKIGIGALLHLRCSGGRFHCMHWVSKQIWIWIANI